MGLITVGRQVGVLVGTEGSDVIGVRVCVGILVDGFIVGIFDGI
jgi:hypothetical protein